MKFAEFGKYLKIFLLIVLTIVIYKLFDGIGMLVLWLFSLVGKLSPLFLAFVIAFLMYPLCRKCEDFINSGFPVIFRKKSRIISVVAVYMISAIISAVAVYLILPSVTRSLIEFIKMIPVFAVKATNSLNKLPYVNIELSELDHYINLKQFLTESGWLDIDIYTSGIVEFSSGLINTLLSVMASVYILIDRDTFISYAHKVNAVLPDTCFFHFLRQYARLAIEFSYKYVFCVILDAVIVFLLSFLIMSAMRIKYAPVLALVTGVLNVIPYFGSVVSGIIAVVITVASDGVYPGIVLGVILLLLQQIDANVIQPHLINEKLELRPFWVLAGVFLGGCLFGFWGIITAVPVVALLRTVINDFVKYRLTVHKNKNSVTGGEK